VNPLFRNMASPRRASCRRSVSFRSDGLAFRKAILPALLLCASALGGCSTFTPPEISYDSDVPPLPQPPVLPTTSRGRFMFRHSGNRPLAVRSVARRRPSRRVGSRRRTVRLGSNRARRDIFNAAQVYAYSPGALYQVYAAPGQITDIALEEGEQLTGSGPVAAGDTVRWVVGDTESGSADTRRVHILVKPTRASIETNLVVNTDRRTYLIELRAREKPYMPSVAWYYPEERSGRVRSVPLTPVLPDPRQRRFRYAIEGDSPPWRPLTAYDDGRKVYIEFPQGIVQGEMPPLFVIGHDGKTEIVNYCAYGNVLIVDRLFAAAELRLGGEHQQKVRIVRTDGRSSS
jgi:type IV secretion system protein TrbG